MRRGVFLDRDDTLIDTEGVTAHTPFPGDVVRPDQVRLLPGVGAALEALVRAGFALVVVSNQGAVARGHASIEDVHAVNARLFDLLPATESCGRSESSRPHVSRPVHGSLLEAIYFCPYHPQGSVPGFAREDEWRKPSPGMILAAAGDFGIDLSGAWLVGDGQRDIDAGLGAGLHRDRVLHIGPGRRQPSLVHAARYIIECSAPDG